MSTGPSAPTAESVREALRQVMDPEIGINIVDVGLVYEIEVASDHVRITMTMTSPACPMVDMIMSDMDEVLDAVLPERYRIDVDLVWDPPWTPEMMTAVARRHFGWKS